MSIFCLKKIEEPTTVGKQLKKAREALSLTLTEISNKTRIPEKYLAAIEIGDYEKLPKTKAHRQAYIRTYADFLKIDPCIATQQFKHENGFSDIKRVHPHRHLRLSIFSSFSLLTRYAVIVGAALIFIFFLAWQIRGIVTPPHLTLYTPMEGSVTARTLTLVQGITEKECALKINGQDVRPDEQGKFSIEIGLNDGINTITVTAIKKHGKSTTVTRHIIVQNTTL